MRFNTMKKTLLSALLCATCAMTPAIAEEFTERDAKAQMSDEQVYLFEKWQRAKIKRDERYSNAMDRFQEKHELSDAEMADVKAEAAFERNQKRAEFARKCGADKGESLGEQRAILMRCLEQKRAGLLREGGEDVEVIKRRFDRSNYLKSKSAE